jgi:hypothetical protein
MFHVKQCVAPVVEGPRHPPGVSRETIPPEHDHLWCALPFSANSQVSKQIWGPSVA